jgi:pteridine reductase
MDIEGSVAIVTGSGVRLGRALALALSEQGARLVIHYHSSAGAARAVIDQIQAAGGQAISVQADLGRLEQVRSIVERAADHFGQVDVLVNSAAIFEPGRWEDTDEEMWNRHFAINLKAPFFLSQAFAAHVGRERRAHIVNIADWRGARPADDHVAYTLTKAGLIAMTESLALALAPNIQVNAVAPGAILPPPDEDQAYLERIAQGIPARGAGSPEDVARALIFLLQSDYVTGELVFVTGGQHL